MPDNEPAKLSAELLHQLLGEYVEKAGQAWRRREQIRRRFWILALLVLGSCVWLGDMPDGDRVITFLTMMVGIVAVFVRTALASAEETTAVQLAAWQLRRIYELASRYEDTGPEIEPALRIGIVLKLGEAQLLLRRLEKFEPKGERFAEMRSLGPDPLKLQPREQARPSVTPDLATTER